jgi:hypothetical protein
MNKDNACEGSSFDDFLAEEGSLEECTAIAMKRVITMQLADAMKKNHITRVAMAKKMHTSRAQLNRILDPEETGTSIESIARAAVAMGKRLEIYIS